MNNSQKIIGILIVLLIIYIITTTVGKKDGVGSGKSLEQLESEKKLLTSKIIDLQKKITEQKSVLEQKLSETHKCLNDAQKCRINVKNKANRIGELTLKLTKTADSLRHSESEKKSIMIKANNDLSKAARLLKQKQKELNVKISDTNFWKSEYEKSKATITKQEDNLRKCQNEIITIKRSSDNFFRSGDKIYLRAMGNNLYCGGSWRGIECSYNTATKTFPVTGFTGIMENNMKINIGWANLKGVTIHSVNGKKQIKSGDEILIVKRDNTAGTNNFCSVGSSNVMMDCNTTGSSARKHKKYRFKIYKTAK